MVDAPVGEVDVLGVPRRETRDVLGCAVAIFARLEPAFGHRVVIGAYAQGVRGEEAAESVALGPLEGVVSCGEDTARVLAPSPWNTQT